jgi:hypothetical protein
MDNFVTSAITAICVHRLGGGAPIGLGRCPSCWKGSPRYGALYAGLLWPESTVESAKLCQSTFCARTVDIQAAFSFKLGTQPVCAEIRAEEVRVSVPFGRVICFEDELIFGQCCSKKNAIV